MRDTKQKHVREFSHVYAFLVWLCRKLPPGWEAAAAAAATPARRKSKVDTGSKGRDRSAIKNKAKLRTASDRSKLKRDKNMDTDKDKGKSKGGDNIVSSKEDHSGGGDGSDNDSLIEQRKKALAIFYEKWEPVRN